MASTNSHPSFTHISSKHIASLDVEVSEFTHNKTGAQHIHIASESDENVFLVALRTVPEDSTGVAHILEHTALCGSEKYPVRDPFFMMTRRSLNTFMNAFTSSDWTAYPFASANKKDFNNLLDVYLDAVFFARLDPLDFAQEGHRLEFQDPKDANSPLEYKGVVYNEMKGAMSSVTSQLWQTLSKHLFPTTTYHFNSGGEPDDIPDLSYEQLVDFYKTHYHPSNASFMTFGDITACEHQEKFERQVLSRFDKLDKEIAVGDEKRYYAPLRVQESYASDEEDLSNKTHVVLAWLLGDSTDLKETLKAQLLSSVLLDNSACPLMHALESTDLGNAPSPLCGLDDSQKHLSFMCGLSGADQNSTDAIEALILDTLRNVQKDGIPQADIEAALHQLELHQREIGGDSYPYGLQLILKCLTGATHRGDAAAMLDLDAALSHLREEIKDPQFIQTLVEKHLLGNPHLVRLSLTPDADIAERKIAAERLRLDAIQKQLSPSESQKIIEQAEALKVRQQSDDDASILPKVTLDDVPLQEVGFDATAIDHSTIKVSTYDTATNGLCYEHIVFPLPSLEATSLPTLSLYSSIITELGTTNASYLDMQKRQSAVCGGIGAFSSIRGGLHTANELSANYIFSTKALASNISEASALLLELINSARFDELKRISELLAQLRIGMEQNVTSSGHTLAMSAAASSLSLPAHIQHLSGGLAAVKDVKALHEGIQDSDKLEQFAQQLQAIHHKITAQRAQVLLVGEKHQLDNANLDFSLLSSGHTDSRFTRQDFQSAPSQQAWICNSQVNFCARAFPTVSSAHEDAAALVVLANYLRNSFLHRSIREQGGAYGGGASQDNNGGVFRFYSYRDPRMAETLDDFDASVSWLKTSTANKDKLEEAILGTIGSLDHSESPAGKAKRCFHADLHGKTLEHRNTFRQRVLNCQFDDLVRVASTYLNPEKASTCVVTGKTKTKEAERLGLETHFLL